MADFTDQSLTGSRFDNVDLSGTEFRNVDLSDATFKGVRMGHLVMHGVDLFDVDFRGDVQNVRINGVDIAPLVEAELDRRYPGRATM